MGSILANATTLVANQVRVAAADPLALVAANPLRTLVHRHASAQPSVACLNAFLRGELAAVGSLRELIERMEIYPFQEPLRKVLASHEGRVTALSAAIARAGTAATTDELRVRGRVLAARLAGLISERKAVALLHGREQLSLRVYRGAHQQLDEEGRRLLAYDLLPEQERSAAIVAGLAKKL